MPSTTGSRCCSGGPVMAFAETLFQSSHELLIEWNSGVPTLTEKFPAKVFMAGIHQIKRDGIKLGWDGHRSPVPPGICVDFLGPNFKFPWRWRGLHHFVLSENVVAAIPAEDDLWEGRSGIALRPVSKCRIPGSHFPSFVGLLLNEFRLPAFSVNHGDFLAFSAESKDMHNMIPMSAPSPLIDHDVRGT